jgi:glycerophosphoryl diester phosphodiesterase
MGTFTSSQVKPGILARVAVAYLDHPRPLAFAHRGGAAHRPENSWPVFQYAVQLGYAYLETDVRATADGTLLAFHDARLGRVTGRRGRVAALPYAEVAKARIAGTEPIPLVEDLLGTWPEMRFNLDVKHDGSIAPLARALKRTRAWDRVCVTSFSWRRLRQAAALTGRPVCTGLDPAAILALRYAGRAGAPLAIRVARTGAQCAQVPAWIATRAFVATAQSLGMHVHVWTLNTRPAIERALDLGADGVMTDELVLLKDVLSARNLWNPRSVLRPQTSEHENFAGDGAATSPS